MNPSGIRELVKAALLNNTDAAEKVYSPRDWPTFSKNYPCLMVQQTLDIKESLGRNGAQQFTTVTTIRVTARVESIEDSSLSGALAAENALENLQDQIVRAVINSYDLTIQIQQIRNVRCIIDVNSNGDSHLGQLAYEFDIEYYQGPEDFYPVKSVPLEGIDTTLKMPDGTTEPTITINLPQE
jgi:hypothetical protein